MTTAKSASIKTASSAKSSDTANSNYILTQITDASATHHTNMVQCFLDVSEISRNASQSLVDGMVNYGSEISEIGSAWALALNSTFAEPEKLLAASGEARILDPENVSAVTKQMQRVLDANSRMADVARTAFGTLADVQACFLSSIAISCEELGLSK